MSDPRILIVDDHAIVREGLKFLLRAQLGSAHIEEAQSGEEGIRLLHRDKWDIVLLDISLPGRSGIDVLHKIKSSGLSVPVLMLSMHPEEQYALRAIRAGAAGYLTKESAPTELVEAVRKVVGGGRYVSASLAERLAREFGRAVGGLPHERLSDREFDVLRMIASGMTVSQIAEKVSLSVKTISTYRARVLQKMGLKNNAELTHYALTHGIV
ncbi:MAG: response regulator transcription factor [Gammaproteobacteria bacterium]